MKEKTLIKNYYSLLKSASGTAKCDRSLFKIAPGITQYDRLLLQSASGITKYYSYYKVRRKRFKSKTEWLVIPSLESKATRYFRSTIQK